jgi:hypothetical protein
MKVSYSWNVIDPIKRATIHHLGIVDKDRKINTFAFMGSPGSTDHPAAEAFPHTKQCSQFSSKEEGTQCGMQFHDVEFSVSDLPERKRQRKEIDSPLFSWIWSKPQKIFSIDSQ